MLLWVSLLLLALSFTVDLSMSSSSALPRDEVVGGGIGPVFQTKGNKIYKDGQWIKFKGIGISCTEYMMKPGMDDGSKDYYGSWAYNYCFGGPPSKDVSTVSLNTEVQNVLKYLAPSSANFNTNPTVNKVAFKAPYSSVIDQDSPQAHPIIRVPMCGSCYLYDIDNDSGNHTMYQSVIDKIIQYFTTAGVAVILDLHWSCPDSTKISGCQGAQASMAQRNYGSQPGSVVLWDQLSSKYGGNPYVLYELYNEPWIQIFESWYAGDTTYAGMKEMYETVRKNAPDSLVVIGGKDQYALDPQSGLAFFIRYKQETGSAPTNIIWNVHPYQGYAQGLEHSLRSAMRITLALKQIGPVIFTEFGQYCCGTGTGCRGGTCSDHAHADYFVYNIVNLCEQYDISWIGWAWRGTNVNNANRPCTDGMAECNQPDMRDTGGVFTDGTHGGANWKLVWSTFVSSSTINVNDVSPTNVSKLDYQPQGFLPRPCIVGQFNLGAICGYDLSVNIETLNYTDLIAQSLYDSILPGLPPSGNCTDQGCEGYQCQTYTGPCKQ